MTDQSATPVAPNQTIAKFGYPQTLLAEYDHWVVLLRPKQVTLGALVLACKDLATSFSHIDQEAFAELRTATGEIEEALGKAFDFDKINYLMLMMVDPHVHFHVIPRYSAAKTFEKVSFVDAGWPAAPDLTSDNELSEDDLSAIVAFLRERWPSR